MSKLWTWLYGKVIIIDCMLQNYTPCGLQGKIDYDGLLAMKLPPMWVKEIRGYDEV